MYRPDKAFDATSAPPELEEIADQAFTSDKAAPRTRLAVPRRLFGSTGSALAVLLMAGAITFGATAIGPMAANPRTGDRAAAEAERPATAERTETPPEQPARNEEEADATPKPDEPEPTPKPEEPEATPKTEEPKPEEPKPTDPPSEDEGVIHLEASVKEGYVKLGWSKFMGDGFEAYKVVRSGDNGASWPMGEADELVGVVGDQWSPWFADKPPCGHEFHYRVFAVRHTEEGYQVLAESNAVGAYVECHDEEEPPDPSPMWLEASLTDSGKVRLTWEQCSSEDFVAYKLVRTKVNDAPSFPLKDGDQLIAAIGDHEATSFKDTDVAAGQTWTYRVYSVAKNDHGEWYILGRSEPVSITVE
jgi:hypothetical protein